MKKFRFTSKYPYSSVHSTNMNKVFRENGNLFQKLKPILIHWASSCIQFEIGTEFVKILNFSEISQSSEQLIRDLSESKELERKKKSENFEIS